MIYLRIAGLQCFNHQFCPARCAFFGHQLERIMLMMKVEPELSPVIMKAAAHHINPHCRLGSDMMGCVANTGENIAKPSLIFIDAVVKIMDDAQNTLLAHNGK